MNFEEYPKNVVLKEGTQVVLRPMVREDEAGLLAFFRGLPDSDRTFLRDDVTSAEVIHDWAHNIDYQRVLPILAFEGDRVVGDATLHRYPFTWMRHVGSIRVVVSPDFREKGLARVLAAEVFSNAVSAKLDKLTAEMLTDQHEARKVFSKLGFRDEAILKDHVMDVEGTKHDLLIMSNDVNLLWKKWIEFCESVSGTWHMEY